MAKVIVYTLNYCPYCTYVKQLLSQHGVVFEEIDITGNDELRADVAQQSGRQTAPQVFVEGKSIGGYEEVRKLFEHGKVPECLR